MGSDKRFTTTLTRRILANVRSKIKKMRKVAPHTKSLVDRLRSTPILVVSSLLVLIAGFVITPLLVHADAFQSKINALENQNSSAQSQVDSLQGQATSYQNAISILNDQISGLQQAISDNQTKQAQLQQQIVSTQQQITQDKQTLADDLQTMYVNGSMTPIEALATSNNLSDYVDQQVAYNSVQDDLNATITKIASLQASLKQQNAQLSGVIGTEQQQNNQLVSDQSQQQQLLAYNQSQQDSYNQQIKANQSQITALQAEQAAANAKLDKTGSLITSGSCGGSYPASAVSPYGGNWGCDYPLDNTYDNWAMDNRECVSYTAWMVYQTYGINPTGFGNANQWPASARSAGFSVGTTPEVGSVAIYLGGSGDPYGHAMWVVGVSGDQIHVYSYNDGYDGNYYDHWVNASGLEYIYFGG